jgi:hypothetical protein
VYVIDSAGIVVNPFVISSVLMLTALLSVMAEAFSGTLPPVVFFAVHSPSRTLPSTAQIGNDESIVIDPPGNTALLWRITKVAHSGVAEKATVEGVAETHVTKDDVVGEADGFPVGDRVGFADGFPVGEADGEADGAHDAVPVTESTQAWRSTIAISVFISLLCDRELSQATFSVTSTQLLQPLYYFFFLNENGGSFAVAGIAERSARIVAHMNGDHAASVLAYAHHYAAVPTATAAEMVGVSDAGLSFALSIAGCQ